jgi:hypothetical protein
VRCSGSNPLFAAVEVREEGGGPAEYRRGVRKRRAMLVLYQDGKYRSRRN